jgi:AcrR family transcriptional regulator
MAGTGNPAGRPRDADLDRRILRVAQEILAEEGYAAVTVSAVARRAELPRSSVYRRYPTIAVLRYAALFVPAEGLPSPVATGDIRADMAVHIRANAAGFRDDGQRAFLRALLADVVTDADVGRELAERFTLPRLRDVAAVIDDARARGDLPATVDGELAAKAITGAMLYQSLVLDQPIDDRFLAALLDLLFPAAVGR